MVQPIFVPCFTLTTDYCVYVLFVSIFLFMVLFVKRINIPAVFLSPTNNDIPLAGSCVA